MSEKEPTKEKTIRKITSKPQAIDEIVKTEKKPEPEKPKDNSFKGTKKQVTDITVKTELESKKPKKSGRGKDKQKRKPVVQSVDTGKLDLSTKNTKQGFSTGVKVGMTLAGVAIFAIAFYAMYKALEKYRKEKKEQEEADEFIEDEGEDVNEEEFVKETSIEEDAQAEHEAEKTYNV